MEAQQRLEIGQRIKGLRERSPFTQLYVAEGLGITPRAYQKLEEKGTTHYERCEELARIHREWMDRDPEWRERDANWIWDGRDQADNDLMGALDAASEPDPVKRLEDRIASQETLLLSEIRAARIELEALRHSIERFEHGQEEGRSQ